MTPPLPSTWLLFLTRLLLFLGPNTLLNPITTTSTIKAFAIMITAVVAFLPRGYASSAEYKFVPGFIRVEPEPGGGDKGRGEEWFEWEIILSRCGALRFGFDRYPNQA